MSNPYVPMPVRVAAFRSESADGSVRSLNLEFVRPEDAARFSHVPGQFAELSVAGVGEAPMGIASSPTESGALLFSIFRTGTVSSALHALQPGDLLGLRGPLGQGFPLSQHRGKHIVIVVGGVAVTCVRSAIIWLCHGQNRPDFGRITLIYGATSPEMILFKDDWAMLSAKSDELNVDIHLSVDREAENWSGEVGFFPSVLEKIAPHPEQAIALVCGPSAMVKFVQAVLDKLSWSSRQVFVSLENRMKCGIGVCGHCNVGPYYVCKDGPVFSKEILDQLPKEY